MTPDRLSKFYPLGSCLRRGSDIQLPRRCDRCKKVLKRPLSDPLEAEDSFCDASCFQAAKEEHARGKLRALVFERDHGFCAYCQCDTVGLRIQLDTLIDLCKSQEDVKSHLDAHDRLSAIVHGFVVSGFPRKALETKGASLWEADHIIARVEGGSSGIFNAQSLCIACHAEKTAALAKDRAASRRPLESRGFQKKRQKNKGMR